MKAKKQKFIEEIKPVAPSQERLMLPSEFAREDGLNNLDFKWWDTNEKKVTIERYKQIKKIIYGGN